MPQLSSFWGLKFYQLLQFLSGEFFFRNKNAIHSMTSLVWLNWKKLGKIFAFYFQENNFSLFYFTTYNFILQNFYLSVSFFVEILSLLTKKFWGRISMYCKNVSYPVIYFLQLLFTCLSFVFDFLICTQLKLSFVSLSPLTSFLYKLSFNRIFVCYFFCLSILTFSRSCVL